MKLLFMHNAIPEYRIPWFKKINERCDVHFVFTNEKIIKKQYHFDTDFSNIKNLSYELIGTGIQAVYNIKKLLSTVRQYDFIMLPPCDSLREFLICYLICLKARKYHVPFSYFWEKWESPKEKQNLKRKLINLYTNTVAGTIFKKADLVFAGSTSCRKYFERMGVSKDKIIVIPDASMTPICKFIDIRDTYHIPREKILVLFFGRLLFQKGAYSLVQAFANVDPDVYHLLIAGDGQDRERTENFVRTNRLSNVTFAGWIHPAERYNFFSQCDMFVFPGNFYQGRTDVWGLTVVEAIENGKPIISTNAIGSAIDLIRDGENGFLLDATLPPEEFVCKLTQCIERIVSEGMIKKAAKYNEVLYEKYSFDAMTDVFFEGITTCILKQRKE